MDNTASNPTMSKQFGKGKDDPEVPDAQSSGRNTSQSLHGGRRSKSRPESEVQEGALAVSNIQGQGMKVGERICIMYGETHHRNASSLRGKKDPTDGSRTTKRGVDD